jgi:positive regulator of sigma E activity
MATPAPTTRPTVWSLVSSIGLVYFVPLLVLLMVAIVTGDSFGIGLPELTLMLVVYVVGFPWVVLRWISRRRQSTRAAAA